MTMTFLDSKGKVPREAGFGVCAIKIDGVERKGGAPFFPPLPDKMR